MGLGGSQTCVGDIGHLSTGGPWAAWVGALSRVDCYRLELTYEGLAGQNHIMYAVCIRCFLQGFRQIYGHTQC